MNTRGSVVLGTRIVPTCSAGVPLTTHRPEFQLLESILWTPEEGYFILEYHLKRLKQSVEYFNYLYEEQIILNELDTLAKSLQNGSYKVRLLLDKNGQIEIQSAILDIESYSKPLKVKLADDLVNSSDIFL